MDIEEKGLKKFEHVLANMGAYVSSIVIFLTTLLITVGSLGRYFFNFNIPGVDEISAYMLIAVTYLGLAYTLREDAHINITILVSKLKGRIIKKLNIILLFISLLVVIIYFYFSLDALTETIRKSEIALTVLQTPLWIPKSVICVGWALFFISMFRIFIDNIKKVFYRKGAK
jgi:TRAP-type C4-dicarboxylate transport system permease small subunit